MSWTLNTNMFRKQKAIHSYFVCIVGPSYYPYVLWSFVILAGRSCNGTRTVVFRAPPGPRTAFPYPSNARWFRMADGENR